MANLEFIGQLYHSRSWWQEYFGDETVFEYIGNAQKFQEYVSQRSIVNEILRLAGRRVSITGLINDILRIPLFGTNKDKDTVIIEILDLFDKYNARKSLMKWFSTEADKAVKTNRYFTSVSKHYESKRPLFRANLLDLDSKFVILQGAICHKSHLKDNAPLYEAASHSKCNWVICDFPPIGMDQRNPEFRGELVFLELDEGMENVFAEIVPFVAEVGWFPYCTVAGFINTKRRNIEQFPTISMSLLLQRRTLSPVPHIQTLKRMLQGERQSPNYLSELRARVLLYYLVPLMYRTWRIGYGNIDGETLALLQEFYSKDRSQLTTDLVNLYDNRIFKQSSKSVQQ